MGRKNPIVVLTNTHKMCRHEWLKARKRGLGGSDAAAILGLSAYASPLSVWADKVSEDVPGDEGGVTSETAWRGTSMEEPIARRFARENGLNIVRCNQMLAHPDHPWMLANIDRRIKGKKIGVEIKSVSANTKVDFEGNEVDPRYYCQCMHYLAVTGWEKWILVVWVVDKGLYSFEIHPNPEEIGVLIDVERKFWFDHVVAGVMPDVDGSEASAEALKLTFPKSTDETMMLSNEDEIAEYMRLDEQIKALTADRDLIKQRIQQEMGACERGTTANYTVRWKSGAPSSSFDKKRFAAECPDLYQKYLTVGSPVRRFTVKKGA